jgi:hypothetical protein
MGWGQSLRCNLMALPVGAVLETAHERTLTLLT